MKIQINLKYEPTVGITCKVREKKSSVNFHVGQKPLISTHVKNTYTLQWSIDRNGVIWYRT